MEALAVRYYQKNMVKDKRVADPLMAEQTTTVSMEVSLEVPYKAPGDVQTGNPLASYTLSYTLKTVLQEVELVDYYNWEV